MSNHNCIIIYKKHVQINFIFKSLSNGSSAIMMASYFKLQCEWLVAM